MKGDWRRVTRAERCPVCGKPDWCLVAGPEGAPEAVLCQRVESPKRIGEAGWLHVLRESATVWPKWRTTFKRAVKLAAEAKADGEPIGFGKLVGDARRAVQPEALERFADSLGLSVDSLRRLGVGWYADKLAWGWPMWPAEDGEPVGVRLRLAGGRKLSIRGGREGLFMPDGLRPGGRLFIAEGPTDTAALLDLGFSAIGRPSCAGGTRHTVNVVRNLASSDVVIVADADAPGLRGAEALASRLAAYCGDVWIITPPMPHKDARAWLRAGGTAADVRAAIDAAEPRRIRITVKGR